MEKNLVRATPIHLLPPQNKTQKKAVAPKVTGIRMVDYMTGLVRVHLISKGLET